ncbi:MAG: hypothetical protein BAJALOKI1v1_140005 [Promethearchaeota archaeon]|nr:MAG: hypothetical protein BAJALOKI1v1_140005 [Candidatus Lokiarchaeota archaeon]
MASNQNIMLNLLNDVPEDIKSSELYEEAMKKHSQCSICNKTLSLIDYINSNLLNGLFCDLGLPNRIKYSLKLWNSENLKLYCCDCYFVHEVEDFYSH